MEEILNWYLTDRNTRVVRQEEDKFWGSFHTKNIYDVGLLGFKAIYTALAAKSLPHDVNNREWKPVQNHAVIRSINSCTDWYGGFEGCPLWYVKLSMHMSHFNTCERVDFEFGTASKKAKTLTYTNEELIKEGILEIDNRMTIELFNEISALHQKESKNESL